MSDTAAEIEIAILGLLFLGVLIVFVGALHFASRLDADRQLVTSLSLLTALALVGFVAVGGETLGAIAAGGVGALGGVLASRSIDKKENEQ